MACDRQACEMVNTPRLDTSTSQPVITDLLPPFMCAAPGCEAEALRFLHVRGGRGGGGAAGELDLMNVSRILALGGSFCCILVGSEVLWGSSY